MAKDNSNVKWSTVDPNSLNEKQRAAYNAYKAAYKTASEAREAFESMIRADMALVIPAGKTVAFGYRFGQLGMAIVDAAKPTTPKKAVPLAAALAA